MNKVYKNNIFFNEIRSILLSGQSVTIPVKGYSMGPFLREERDNVTIAPLADKMPGKGEIVLFSNKLKDGTENFIMHRIIKKQGDRFTLRGDNNPLKMKEYCSVNDILGIVTSCNRKGKHYTPDNFLWRGYALLKHIYLRIRSVDRKLRGLE
ncbi:MAG: hypothetical protein Q4B21_05700 [Bacteroidia bacterium]|nr:hypothetical protein [Bacteroidia bacterium]